MNLQIFLYSFLEETQIEDTFFCCWATYDQT